MSVFISSLNLSLLLFNPVVCDEDKDAEDTRHKIAKEHFLQELKGYSLFSELILEIEACGSAFCRPPLCVSLWRAHSAGKFIVSLH